MKKEILTASILIAFTLIAVFIGRKIIDMIMGVQGKLVPFMKKWEGGLSRATTDTASSNPAPFVHNGKSGYHTNMGITWTAFVQASSKLGFDPSYKNFFYMSDSLWLEILQEMYMKPYPLKRLSHLPRIQAVIITWAWGSGLNGSESRLARFQRQKMGIIDSNISKEEIVNNFLKRINPINEKHWFDLLCQQREEDFRNMNQPQNLKGWLNRLEDFKRVFA